MTVCRLNIIKAILCLNISGGEKMIYMNHNGEVEEMVFSAFNSSKIIMDNSTFVRSLYIRRCT